MKQKKNKFGTIADVMQAALQNPNAFSSSSSSSRRATNAAVSSSANGRREVNANGRYIDIGSRTKGRRTRKKVERPRQQYVYAGQRRISSSGTDTGAEATIITNTGGGAPRRGNSMPNENITGDYYDDVYEDDYDDEFDTYEDRTGEPRSSSNNSRQPIISHSHPLSQQQQLQQTKERTARMEYLISLGLSDPYSSQIADAIVGDGPEEVPQIVETIRLPPKTTSDTAVSADSGELSAITAATTASTNSYAYILYKPVGWSILGDKKSKKQKNEDTDIENEDGGVGVGVGATIAEASQDRRVGSKMSTARRVKAYDEQLDDFTYVEYNEEDVLAAMTPAERAELMMEGGLDLDDLSADAVRDTLSGAEWDDDGNESEGIATKRKKMKQKKDSIASSAQPVEGSAPQRRSTQKANLETIARPSLVNWLKEYKANEGTPIKGGKYWIALAGATEIDDSGLVLLCPRDRVDSVNVEESSYVAVVGNGKKLTSRSRLVKSIRSGSSGSSSIAGKEVCDTSLVKIDILSRLKKWREDDPVASVSLTFPMGISTCNHAVLLCQDRFGDGVRGDATTDPLDRRSPRRLVHCTSLLASSSSSALSLGVASKSGMVDPTTLPDDIASYANRRDGSSFSSGGSLV